MVLLRGSVLLVGLFQDAEEVALFAVADRFFSIPALGMTLFAGVVAARMARLWTAGDHTGMQRVYEISLGVAAVSFGAGILTLMLTTTPLLHAVSPKYPDAAPLIWILLAVSLPRVLGLVASVGVLLATGKAGPLVLATVVEVAATTAGAALFVPRYGALGMAVVAAVVHAGFAAASILMVRRHMGLRFRITLRGAREVLFPTS
jgi:O-antigen/teichoic acid export membrane protein